MNVERLRALMLGLPDVVETMQWGDNLVFWVGDKAIGGKMFALVNLHGDGKGVLSYPAGQARYNDLLEIEGILPAPYLARVFWVAVERWDVFRPQEWEAEMQAAHALTLAKLPPKALRALALPKAEQRRLIAARRKLLAAKARSRQNPSNA